MKRSKYLVVILFFLSVITLKAQYNFELAFPSLSFSSALDLQNAGDGTDRIFVVERAGVIKVIPNDQTVTTAQVFLNITDRVTSGGETGLLGLAFHPDYESNGYFYVDYTAPNPLRTVISRFQFSPGDPNVADPSSELVLLEFTQPYSNHNGGQVAFGPDGYLYIATGDGGSGGDPQNNAQTITNLLGKILRIDVDNPLPPANYGIPPTNPFADSTNTQIKKEIYAWGLRNPWRFSFDPVTGWLWCGDVGQNAWEEVDIIENGKNYGWRCYEGNHPYNTSGCNGTYEFPIWEYSHSEGFSITGGYVHRGARVPELTGKYIYGDYGTAKVWALEYDGINPAVNTQITTAAGSITSFGRDESGEIYLVSFNNKLYRFISTNPVSAPTGMQGILSQTLVLPPHWTIDLTWNDNANNEDGYYIERKTNNGPFEVIATLPANSVNYNDNNVADTTFYSYRVRAYNSANSSIYSNYYYVDVPARTADEPLNLIASAISDQAVEINWTNQNFNAYATKIERKTGVNGAYTLLDSVNSGVQTYTDTNVQDQTTYFYRAFAYYENIVSPYSNEDSAFVPGVVSVELASFNATVVKNGVKLEWFIMSELNNSGFSIERSQDGVNYNEIYFIKGRGTSTIPNIYSYTDLSVKSGVYYYRLKQVDQDGTFKYLRVAEVNVGYPETFTLEQNYPNPFNPVTTIKYTIPNDRNFKTSGNESNGLMVTLKVYDIIGNEVASLVNEIQQPGIYEVNLNAEKLTSGIYFYKLTAGEFSSTKKMVLMK